MIEPKSQALDVVNKYFMSVSCVSNRDESKECAKIDINGKIDLLRELNEVNLCQFNKEIEYWEEVLKEVDSL